MPPPIPNSAADGLKTSNSIAEFQEKLQRYIEVSKKIPGDAIAKQTRELDMDLYFGFHRIRPVPRTIAVSAAARHFAMRRVAGRTIAKVAPTGVSAAALERAKTLLEGAASDFFRVTENDGVPVVRLARIGRNPNKLLKGGRRGNKFSGSARSLTARFDVQGFWRGATREHIARLRELHPELRRLNLQALSIAIEIGYRARAAKGGTMSLQFLHRVYKNRSSSTVKSGPLIARTRAGKIVGEVRFQNQGGQLAQTNIIGTVPGTAAQAAKHGIVSDALRTRAADMQKYIERKMGEAKRAAGIHE